MGDWRYSIEHDTVNNHTTITRGRVYRLSDTGCDTSDLWSNYWEGGEHVAFYDKGYKGIDIPNWADPEQSERAVRACTVSGVVEDLVALKKVAVRLTGNPDADFICVGLNQGSDLYVLSWGGDPDNEWRDEIEAVNSGDIWRCEVEEYTGHGLGGVHDAYTWHPADDVCEEWYGEDKANAALVKMFPETEFPAELLVQTDGS